METKTKIIFHTEVKKYREEINRRISATFRSRKPRSLYDPLFYFMKSGGKRLRAIILLLTSRLFIDDETKLPYDQAVALELLHNFTLIHDDIMDNSKKRHNKPTVHIKYNLNTAILSGDAMLGIAYDHLGKNLKINRDEIFNEFTKTLLTVCEGQALDEEFEEKKKISMVKYIDMISKKTAFMIKGACTIGALVGNADPDTLTILGKFGLNLGLAYQIQDDYLDLFGNEEALGKAIGSDLLEGKRTYPILLMLKMQGTKELDKAKKLIKNKQVRKSHLKQLIDILKSYNIDEKNKQKYEYYYNQALNELSKINQLEKIYLLKSLTEMIMNRDR